MCMTELLKYLLQARLKVMKFYQEMLFILVIYMGLVYCVFTDLYLQISNFIYLIYRILIYRFELMLIVLLLSSI